MLALIIIYVAIAFMGVGAPVSSWVYGFMTIVVLGHDILVPLAFISLMGEFAGAQADILFVTIDHESSCFGTLVEVGMAVTLGKIILVNINNVPLRKRWDLWFTIEASQASLADADMVQHMMVDTAFRNVPHIRNSLGRITSYLEVTKKYTTDRLETAINCLLAQATDARREMSARVIQRAWRNCIANPQFLVCVRRLQREFDEGGDSVFEDSAASTAAVQGGFTSYPDCDSCTAPS